MADLERRAGADAMKPLPRAGPEQLTIASRAERGTVTLVVRGEVDLASASALEAELRKAERSHPRRIVLDFGSLAFIDSAGVHILISAQRRAEADGTQLVLTHVPRHARRLFSLVGIADRLSFE